MAVSNEWKNLRSFLRKTYNREVNEWFNDVTDPVPDNSTPRKQAKKACLIRGKDSQNMALLKSLTFRYTIQRVHLRPDVYGTPIGTINAQRKYRPQIVLEFLEDELDVASGYFRVDGRISYRLMNEDSNSITNSELTQIANRIKSEFGAINGYVWKKGKDLATYTDKEKGYQFQLLVRNKTDAKDLITSVVNTNGDIPDWGKLSYKEADNPTDAYPTIPGNQTILGQTYKKPRVRPIAEVRFQYAYCSLWGKAQPVILFDRSYRYFNALVQ